MSEELDKGIILKVTEHGESDQIVWMYTEHRGKQSFKARAARKSKRRFAGLLQTFSHHTLAFKPQSQGWPILLRVEPIALHPGFREHLEGFAAASYCAELFLRLTQEGDPNPALYTLLQSFLGYAEGSDITPKVLCRFHLRLLHDLGLQPNWEYCMECGSSIDRAASSRFEFEQGGLLCNRCFHHIQTPLLNAPLSPQLRSLFVHLQERTALPPELSGHWSAAVELLDRRITGLLGKRPQSRTFLSQMVDF